MQGQGADVVAVLETLSRGGDADAAFEELLALREELEGAGRGDVDRLVPCLAALATLAEPLGLAAEDVEELRATSLDAALEAGGVDRGALPLLLTSQVAFRKNLLDEADGLASFGVEVFAESWRYVPHLWRVRAEVERKRGRFELARERLAAMEEALDAAPEPGSAADAAFLQALRAEVLGATAQVWTELGVLDVAFGLLEEADEAARASGNPRARVATLLQRADWALQGEDPESAVTWLGEARSAPWLEAVDAEGRTLVQLSLGIALAELQRRGTGDPAEALEVLRSGLAGTVPDLRLRARALLVLVDLEARDGDGAGVRAHLAELDELARTSLGEHQIERSLHTALLSRLARREDLEVEPPPLAAVEAAWDRLLDEWLATPTRSAGIGFLNNPERRLLLAELIERCAADGRLEEALEQVVRAQAVSDRTPGETPGVAELRSALLREDQGLLVYVPARHGSHLLLLDRDELRHVALPARPLLREVLGRVERTAARDWRALSEAQRTGHAARLAAQLGEAAAGLLPPEALALVRTWRRVTIVGGDLLTSMPFDVLPLPDGRRLGEALAVSVVQSLPWAVRTARTPAPAAGTDLFLVATLAGDGDAGRGETRLPLATATRRLAEPFSGLVVEELVGTQATVAGLLARREELGRAAVVHFLAHGTYDAGLERGACLSLTPDGARPDRLSCDEVEAELSVSGLVVLSSCQAALGPQRLGPDNLAHLGGAFLRSGARSVLLTRARLEYASTVRVMELVHRGLAAGLSPAEALRSARAELARDGDALDTFELGRLQVLGLGQEACRLTTSR